MFSRHIAPLDPYFECYHQNILVCVSIVINENISISLSISIFSTIIILTESILVASSNNELAPAGANPLDSGLKAKVLVLVSVFSALSSD